MNKIDEKENVSIGAGIFGVIGVVTISDLAKGTGRFNFSLSLMALSQGIGASTSNVIAGSVVNQSGYNTGFYVLAGVGLAGSYFTVYGCRKQNIKIRILND